MSMRHQETSAIPMLFDLPIENARKGLQFIRHAFASLAHWKTTIRQSEEKVISMIPEIQSVKIQRDLSSKTENLPELRCSGQWLSEAGFHSEQEVSIVILQDMLIICPKSVLEEAKGPID